MLDKNRPIVFLSATTVMENTIERFAIHQLPELGYQVTIVDLSKIVDARVFGGVSISEWNVENIRRECYDHILQFDTFVAAHPDSYYFLLFDYYYVASKKIGRSIGRNICVGVRFKIGACRCRRICDIQGHFRRDESEGGGRAGLHASDPPFRNGRRIRRKGTPRDPARFHAPDVRGASAAARFAGGLCDRGIAGRL